MRVAQVLRYMERNYFPDLADMSFGLWDWIDPPMVQPSGR